MSSVSTAFYNRPTPGVGDIVTTRPTSPVEGQVWLYFDESTGKLYREKLWLGTIYSAELSLDGEYFTPAGIATSLWLDAADETTITASAGAVSTWADKSGNGYNVTQGTGAAQPLTGTRDINGINCLDFDGDDDALFNNNVGTALRTADIMMFVVASTDDILDTEVNGILTSNITDVTRTGITFVGADIDTRSANGVVQVPVDKIGAVVNNEVAIICHKRDYDTVNTTLELYTNGALDDTASFAGAQDTSGTKLYIGWLNSDRFLNGRIGEVVVTEAKDDATRQNIEGYLAWKWGLQASLPSDHPYKLFRPLAGD
jgi:hypothetical protein